MFSKTKNVVRSRACFYSFGKLFNFWLHRKKIAGFSFLLLHLTYCNMLFWLKNMKKLQTYTDMQFRKVEYLIAFQMIVDIFLWFASETQQVLFLKGELPCGIWNHLNELGIVHYTKIHELSICVDFLTYAWFSNIMSWPFEKYWFTELCRSSKCWAISLSITKSRIR